MASPTVTFPCPFCGRRMGVPAELLGKQVRCPHCKQVVLAPTSVGPAQAPGAAPPAPVQPPPTSAPAPVFAPVPPPPPAPTSQSPHASEPNLPVFSFAEHKEGA